MKQGKREQPFRPPAQGSRGLRGWTGFGKKTLWDWLQLLIVPAAIAIVGFLIAAAQGYIQLQAEEQRALAQRESENQRAQDTALQAYIDEMGSLLIDESLFDPEDGDKLRTLARARTLTVLQELDPERKGRVLQFLSESDLISKEDPIVDLHGANLEEVRGLEANLKDTALTGAKMPYAQLTGADLSGAHLGGGTFLLGADLRGANLRGAYLFATVLDSADLSRLPHQPTDLRNADLREALLVNANLNEAIITEEQLSSAGPKTGATLPDGSTDDSSWPKEGEPFPKSPANAAGCATVEEAVTSTAGTTTSENPGRTEATAEFFHTAASQNIVANSTYIEDPSTLENPDAILLAEPGGNAAGNRPTGVWYDASRGGRWAVFNQDLLAMAGGETFDVRVWEEPGGDVFVHCATSENIEGNETYVDHPSLNGNPDAVFSLTPNWNPGGGAGTYVNAPVATRYDAGEEKWAILREDLAPMPEGSAFNMVVTEGATTD